MVLSNNGNVDHAQIQLIIRDFDTDGFEKKKKLVDVYKRQVKSDDILMGRSI